MLRRVARPDGMILVRERRAEERHGSVAHDLVDRALVTVDASIISSSTGSRSFRASSGSRSASGSVTCLLALPFERGRLSAAPHFPEHAGTAGWAVSGK